MYLSYQKFGALPAHPGGMMAMAGATVWGATLPGSPVSIWTIVLPGTATSTLSSKLSSCPHRNHLNTLFYTGFPYGETCKYLFHKKWWMGGVIETPTGQLLGRLPPLQPIWQYMTLKVCQFLIHLLYFLNAPSQEVHHGMYCAVAHAKDQKSCLLFFTTNPSFAPSSPSFVSKICLRPIGPNKTCRSLKFASKNIWMPSAKIGIFLPIPFYVKRFWYEPWLNFLTCVAFGLCVLLSFVWWTTGLIN